MSKQSKKAKAATQDHVAPARLGVKIMTIVFLETGQVEVTGPLGMPGMCREMLDAARKVVNQAEALTPREPAALPDNVLESPAQKMVRERVEGAKAS